MRTVGAVPVVVDQALQGHEAVEGRHGPAEAPERVVLAWAGGFRKRCPWGRSNQHV